MTKQKYSVTDSLIQGIAKSWSKARSAASRSTVKAPGSKGPLKPKQCDKTKNNSLSLFCSNLRPYDTTPGWLALYNMKKRFKSSRRTYPDLVKLETRLELVENIDCISLFKKKRNTVAAVRWFCFHQNMWDDYVSASALQVVIISHDCSWASLSRPLIRPRSGLCRHNIHWRYSIG